MRELELPEIEIVAGGFGFQDETSTQDPVVVTGTHSPRMSLWEISQILDNLSGTALTGAALVDRIISGAGEAAQDAVEQAEELEEMCPNEYANLENWLDRLDFRELYLEGLLSNPPSNGSQGAAIAFWNLDNAFAIAQIETARNEVENAREALHDCATQ